MQHNRKDVRRFLFLLPLAILLILMFVIFRYVFLYADDFYYSRDARYGLYTIPSVMKNNFETNGRVWVHVLLMLFTKHDALVFRIVNPLAIAFSMMLIAQSAVLDGRQSKQKNRVSVFAFIVCACYFIGLHINIADTTIYYAACSLNYLFPAAVSLLYGVLYTRHVFKDDINRISPLLLVTAFFAASSSQQCGAAAIGYAVMLTVYACAVKKKKVNAKYFINFVPLIAGFAVVIYGSVMRYIRETSGGKSGSMITNLVSLIRMNIFSKPCILFTIVMLLFIIAGLICLAKVHKGGKLFKLDIVLAAVNVSFLAEYILMMCIQEYSFADCIFRGRIVWSLHLLFALCFTAVYLLSAAYIAVMIMLKRDDPFVICSVVNAVGMQLIILLIDAKYTSQFKMILPSQMFMLVFAAYVVNGIFNDFKKGAIVISAAAVTGVLCIASTYTYSKNLSGYREVSKNIAYNLEEIDRYIKNGRSGELVFRRVIANEYGYNNGNWNTMPYFMRDCYKIKRDTVIRYEK